MSIELVHIGFGNILAMSRAIAIASPNSAPTKRVIHEGRNNGKLIDMTSGRRNCCQCQMRRTYMRKPAGKNFYTTQDV